jgi:hypothetical protein
MARNEWRFGAQHRDLIGNELRPLGLGSALLKRIVKIPERLMTTPIISEYSLCRVDATTRAQQPLLTRGRADAAGRLARRTPPPHPHLTVDSGGTFNPGQLVGQLLAYRRTASDLH